MRKLVLLLTLLTASLTAQIQGPVVVLIGSPPGGVGAACTAPAPLYANLVTGVLAICRGGFWVSLGTGGGGSSAFNDITSGVNTTATMIVGSGATLNPASATAGVISANRLNGVSLAGLATGILKNTTTTGIPSIAGSSDIIGLFTGCSGVQYLGADGACHNPGGGGATIPSTTSTLKGDGAGNALAVTGTGTDCVFVNGSSGPCGGSSAPSGPAGGLLSGTYPDPGLATALGYYAVQMGVDCGGVVDTTVALQAAIDAVPNGGTLLFPQGCVMNITDTLHITNRRALTLSAIKPAWTQANENPEFNWNKAGSGNVMFDIETSDHPAFIGFHFRVKGGVSGSQLDEYLHFDGEGGTYIGSAGLITDNVFDGQNNAVYDNNFIAVSISQTAGQNHELYRVENNTFYCSGETAGTASAISGVMTSGSPNLSTGADTPFVIGDVGRMVWVSSKNFFLNTTIASFTDSSHVVLAANAPSSITGAQVFLGQSWGIGIRNGASQNALQQYFFNNSFLFCHINILIQGGSATISRTAGFSSDYGVFIGPFIAGPVNVDFIADENNLRGLEVGDGAVAPILVTNFRASNGKQLADGFIKLGGSIVTLNSTLVNLPGSVPVGGVFVGKTLNTNPVLLSTSNNFNMTWTKLGYGEFTTPYVTTSNDSITSPPQIHQFGCYNPTDGVPCLQVISVPPDNIASVAFRVQAANSSTSTGPMTAIECYVTPNPGGAGFPGNGGTLVDMVGCQARMGNQWRFSGTATGFYSIMDSPTNISGTSAVWNAFWADSPATGGGLAETHGLLISNQSVSGVAVGYGIKQLGTNDLNSFAGIIQQVGRTGDPVCTSTTHIGKFWEDTTTTSTVFKVCNNQGGTVAWQPLGSIAPVVVTATTVYVCPATATNCAYNGDGGQSATPSDSYTLAQAQAKATPWATIAHAQAVLGNSVLYAPLTVQLADTGSLCYQDSELKWQNLTQGSYAYNIFEVGFGSYTDTYPTSYIEIKGNTTTPTNVRWTGASTCAGTTSAARVATRIVGANAVIHGINVKYFDASNDDNGAFTCTDGSACFFDNVTLTNSGTGRSKLTLITGSGTNGYYGPNVVAVEGGLAQVDHNAVALSRTPAGWMTASAANSTYVAQVWIANEGGHITFWGATTETYTGSAAYIIYVSLARATIDNAEAAGAGNPGASVKNINAAAATYLDARQHANIYDSCGSTNNTCRQTSGGGTATYAKRASVNTGGRIETTAPAGSGVDTITTGDGSIVVNPFSAPTGTQKQPSAYLVGQAAAPPIVAASGDVQFWSKTDNTGPYVQIGSSTNNFVAWSAAAITSGQLVIGAGNGGLSVGNLSGDITTSGALVTTLATVNSNTGPCGDSTHVCVITLNGKGLATAATSTAISGAGAPPAGSPLFTTLASTTVTATSATTLIGSVAGTTTIPANTMSLGTVLRWVAMGYYSTPATPAALTIDLKIGGTTRLTTTSATLIPSVTTGTWQLICDITQRTAGASGTQIGNCTFSTTGSSIASGASPMQTSSTWTVDTTATLALDLQATWSTTTGAPTITATNITAAFVGGQTVTAGSGILVTGGAGATPTVAINTGVRVVTGTDSATSADCGNLIKSTSTSSFTETLPQAGTSSMIAGCVIKITNAAAVTTGAVITLSTTTSTFSGAAPFIGPGTTLEIVSDGTNYLIAGPSVQTLISVSSTSDTVSCIGSMSDTAFATTFTIPANLLVTGRTLRVSFAGQLTAVATVPSFIGKLKIAGTTVWTGSTSTPGAQTNTGVGEMWLVHGTAAAGGAAAVETGTPVSGTGNTWAAGNQTAQTINLATNGTLQMTITIICSAAGGTTNSQTLRQFVVEMIN